MIDMRIKSDFEYIWLNKVVCNIPCWTVRKLIYKRHGMKIEKNSRIGIGTIIVCPSGISIGDRTTINEYCFLDGRGGLHIGHDCSVSAYSKIISASHYLNSNSFKYYERKTFISDYVWIGIGAIILDGSVLEEKSVVGAGAVLKGKAESGRVYIGNPAKAIKKRKLDKGYVLNYKPYFR